MSAVVADVVAVRVPERSWRSEVRAVKVVWRRDLIRFVDEPMQMVSARPVARQCSTFERCEYRTPLGLPVVPLV